MIMTVELSKLGKAVEKRAGEMSAQELWAVYFGYLTDRGRRGKINEILEREEGIAMASEVLMGISRDEVERARLMSEEKYQLDIQSKLTYAKREGIAIGEKKGKRKWKKEGEKKIIDLLKSGKSPEEIIKSYEK